MEGKQQHKRTIAPPKMRISFVLVTLLSLFAYNVCAEVVLSMEPQASHAATRRNRRRMLRNRRPSRPPITPRGDAPSPSPTVSCRVYSDSTTCKEDAMCEWIRTRVNGKNFVYGCYSNVPGAFCNFRGTPNEIQQQCNQNGGWCAYNFFSQKCNVYATNKIWHTTLITFQIRHSIYPRPHSPVGVPRRVLQSQ